MRPQAMTKARFIAAMRDAFEAGMEQGGEEATAYGWGSAPSTDRETAFKDLFEKWEKGWGGKSHIRKAMMRCK